MEKPQIRFIDSVNNTLFYLDDGEDIEIEAGDEWIRYTCHYMDDFHFKLGDCIYHIGQFAQLREKLAQRYRPAKKEVKTEAEPKKKIQFIDTSYKTLFCIEDGDEIEVEMDGAWRRQTCHYLDDCHVEINGICFHIHEFAGKMEKASQRFRPVKSETLVQV